MPSCGVLRLSSPFNVTVWGWVLPDRLAGASPDYLVEVRVRPAATADWIFAVAFCTGE